MQAHRTEGLDRGGRTRASVRGLGRWLAVAAGYVLLGRLALLLAIPPGYATAVWPAAGLALVAVLVFGRGVATAIWFGSFLVNVGTSFDSASAEAIIRSLTVATAIGAGAAGQALVGAHLVRRRVSWPSPLEAPRDILALFALSGPLGCVVSASLGVAALHGAGLIRTGEVGFSWITWWVGDTVGCLLVAPAMLLLAARPRPQRRRLAAVGVPLIFGFALATALYIMISGWERGRQRDSFLARATPVVEIIDRQLRDHEDAVLAVTSLFAASEDVSRNEFGIFAARVLRRYPALQGLSWNPVVGEGSRAAFEEAVRGDASPAFVITERDGDGAMSPAARRTFYVPVLFFEPMAGNEAAIGFDVSSEPMRREAMNYARDTGGPAASAVIDLVQGPDDRRGVLLFAPFVRDGNLVGYAVGVLRIDPIVEVALRRREGIVAVVRDLSATGTPILYGAELREAPWWQAEVAVGARRWQISLWPDRTAPEVARSWVAWTVLATGLVLVGLLGTLTMVSTGRSSQIERAAARHREAARAQQMMFELSEAANRALDIETLQLAVATKLGEHLGASRCVFHEIDVAADEALVRRDYHRGVPSLAGVTYRPSSFSAETQADLRAGRTVINHDAATDPRTASRYESGYQPLAIVSYVAVPLFRDMIWTATLWVAYDTPYAWTPNEVVLVHGVAEKAWAWAEQVRMAGELRILNQNLERKVEERTHHLDASLRERVILLKEVHHRVKNNLQVISSLLGLQAHLVVDPAARQMFEESRSRVLAIALVHESLYATKNLAEVGFAAYVRALSASLLASHGGAQRGIRIHIAAEGIELPVTIAIPCGLIINELVINALKHAFVGHGGQIDIELREESSEVVSLRVADDGVGLPADLDLRALPSLGMELVFSFAEQLQASLDVTRAPGTSFTLRFKRST